MNKSQPKHAIEKKPNYTLRRAVALGVLGLGSFGVFKGAEAVDNWMHSGNNPVKAEAFFKDGQPVKAYDGITIKALETDINLRSSCNTAPNDAGRVTSANVVTTINKGSVAHFDVGVDQPIKPYGDIYDTDQWTVLSFKNDSNGTSLVCVDTSALIRDGNEIDYDVDSRDPYQKPKMTTIVNRGGTVYFQNTNSPVANATITTSIK